MMTKLETILNSDFIISFGTFLEEKELKNSIVKAIENNSAKFVYMHPIDNSDLKPFYTQLIKYEVGSEEGICALLLNTFTSNCDENVRNYIDDLDLGYISAESSAGEEEFEEAFENSLDAKFKTLIIGSDLANHERIENIVQLITLLKKYNQDPFHIQHALTVEAVMKWYAKELGYGDDAEYWGIVGLLHDIDFELYPEEHCIKSQEIMKERGIDEKIIHATASHGYAITVDIKPEHEMEKVLYAVDELTGLIGAVVLMRPSKSVQDLTLKSVKKKYKSKNFAAGCSREVIERGADMLGWTLEDLIQRTIDALKTFQD